jgi:hypothetical protein
MTLVAHDQLDCTSEIASLGITHLTFLGSDDRSTALSQKLKERNLAGAIKEEGVSIKYIDCKEPIVKVPSKSGVLVFYLA